MEKVIDDLRPKRAMFRPTRPNWTCFDRLERIKKCLTVFNPSVLYFDRIDPKGLCFDSLERSKKVFGCVRPNRAMF